MLEAEKAAQLQLDTATTQAEAVLQDAQEDARRIATRTDDRIQALHRCFRESITNKKKQFKEAFQREVSARGTEIHAGNIKNVTNRLARQIIGIVSK